MYQKYFVVAALLIGSNVTALNADEKADSVNKFITEATALAKQGNFQQALNDMNQAIALDPSNAHAYNLRGNLYFAMENYTAALADLDRVVQLMPNVSGAYSDRAIVYYAMKNYQPALSDSDTALKLDPTNPVALAVRLKVFKELRAR